MFPTVVCSGTPYEIGKQHGSQAASLVHGSVDFYREFFVATTKLEWDAVSAESRKWLPFIEQEFPQYVEEMKGVADGAGVPFESILALNVRTEIAFGLQSDGCTSMSFHKGDTALLAQNWDWRVKQGANLINLQIQRSWDVGGAPVESTISIITEAGIIGKIGLGNGLGTCLNAISALGVAHDRLPVHLALRAALDWAAEEGQLRGANGVANGSANGAGASTVVDRVAARLEKVGIASAAHVFIADAHKAIGLESSYKEIYRVPSKDIRGGVAVLHSNHYVVPHDVKSGRTWDDSTNRLKRIEELYRGESTVEGTANGSATANGNGHAASAAVSGDDILNYLCDRQGFPTSINREESTTPKNDAQTLFSIVMDLGKRTARVQEGMPDAGGRVFTISA